MVAKWNLMSKTINKLKLIPLTFINILINMLNINAMITRFSDVV